jgi:two-component system chemotaxis response regulator CheY
MRALIVDDSRTMRMIVGNILRELGFEIGQAADGLEALKWTEENGFPELACVDWNMPEMNGLEFVMAIRQIPGNDFTKIIMITTESDAENVASAMSSGANEYLIKPFTKESISQKLGLMGLNLPS